MLRAKRISYVPKFLYRYRYNPNSNSNTPIHGKFIFKICKIVEEILRKENLFEEFIDEFILFKINQILAYLIPASSEEYFQKAKIEFRIIEKKFLNDEIKKKIPIMTLQKFNLILKSNSLDEFINLKTIKEETENLSKINQEINILFKKLNNQYNNLYLIQQSSKQKKRSITLKKSSEDILDYIENKSKS